MGAWTYWLLGGVGALFLPFMSSLKVGPDFGAISSTSLFDKSST